MIECSFLKIAERPISLANNRNGKEWQGIAEQRGPPDYKGHVVPIKTSINRAITTEC